MDRSIIEIDARGLEPPQPMVRILEALENLPAGAELHARTDRRPVHLLALLEARGYQTHSTPGTDLGVLTVISRTHAL